MTLDPKGAAKAQTVRDADIAREKAKRGAAEDKRPTLTSVTERYLRAHGRFEPHTVNKTSGWHFVACECDICQDALKLVGEPEYVG